MSFDGEYLHKVIVSIKRKSFKLYGSDGSFRTIECEEMKSFMNVLNVCKAFLDEELEYENA